MHITKSRFSLFYALIGLLYCWFNSAFANVMPPLQTHSIQQIQHWEQVLAAETLSPVDRFDALLQLAAAYQAGGQAQQAQASLDSAETLLSEAAAPLRYALLYSIYSDLALARREDIQARHYADRSMAVLPAKVPPLIHATLLNNLGNVETAEAYYPQAVASYRAALALAEKTEDVILQVRILTNLARVLFRQQQWPETVQALTQARLRLALLDRQSVAYVSGLLSIAELLLQLYEHHQAALAPNTQNSVKALLLAVLTQAESSAQPLTAPRLQAYAQGYLGRWHELQQNYDHALQATRQAIFFAQQVNAAEILYRWHWQAARIFRQQGQYEAALTAYRDAVHHLTPVRQALTVGYRNAFQSFRDTVGPLYFELADLLLQQARHAEPAARKAWLLEARDTIERLKTAELQDYFQDDCVTTTPNPMLLGDSSAPQTAVLYPIILPDRVEILLSLPNGIQQFDIALTAEQLKDEVNEFRFELETRNTEAFMPYAQRLYQRLIQPLEAILQAQQVATLIVVPDGVLRTIPLAALHTGQAFLIQRYALVTTPGLSLMQAATTRTRPPTILINGLSVAVQEYRALPNVSVEVKQIQAVYGDDATVLMDQTFTEAQFAAELKSTAYDIIHIASHGQFDSDPSKTVLLTYDGYLTMNRLERLIRLSDLRNEPIDLLSLSACQTAVGDDQAALGLAGVALKAGARSALATLWFIDDAASSLLVSEFYRQLQLTPHHKAHALQQAQLHLLQQARYRHPAFWAPFLLIGHWL